MRSVGETSLPANIGVEQDILNFFGKRSCLSATYSSVGGQHEEHRQEVAGVAQLWL